MSTGRQIKPWTTSLNRRDFLKTGAISAGAAAFSLAAAAESAAPKAKQCILLFLVGGPSQLDTWDLKPDAPSEIRGPFRPIRTNVPGIDICEHFPRMAAMADRYAIVRSVHHDAPPVHETGFQLMQTGRLFEGGREFPHIGSVVASQRGLVPPILIPGPIGYTGVSVSNGQTAAHLSNRFEPRALQPVSSESAEQYGETDFGRNCLLARQMIERGSPFVTVNMFDTVFGKTTWDCHADGGSLASTLHDYRDTLCPTFDMAYAALLQDLHQRGLLESTLVVAMGEFGRSPKLNPRGGRDHWPGVWSILFAGGGVKGGQVIGASDADGAQPKDRPVSPVQIASTIYSSLGIEADEFTAGFEPIIELFA